MHHYDLILKVKVRLAAPSTFAASRIAQTLLPNAEINVLSIEAAHPSVHRQRDDFDRLEFEEPFNAYDLEEVRTAA
jgi:hypothetical protein